MPFKSESQRRYMYEKHPDIAKRWSAEFPNQGKLPEKVSQTDALAGKKRKKPAPPPLPPGRAK